MFFISMDDNKQGRYLIGAWLLFSLFKFLNGSYESYLVCKPVV